MLKESNPTAHGLMLITTIFAASSFPVGAAITDELPPAIMMFIRFFLAAILFSPYVFIRNGWHFPAPNRMMAYCVLSIPSAVFFWCMFESLRYTSVLNTSALYTLVPVMTAIYAFFINGEVVGRSRILGLFLGTLGALWIVFRGDYEAFIGLHLHYGDFIFIVGCLFLGTYNPLVKKMHNGEPMEVMTFWVLLFGAAWLLLASGGGIFDVDWLSINGQVYGSVLYLSFFSTLVTFFLLQLSIVKIGPTKVAAYSFLTPILVILISAVIREDIFEMVVLPGIILVILAMFIIQREPVLDVVVVR